MVAINRNSIGRSLTLVTQSNDELEARMINLENRYPDIDYLFERDGCPCISRGDIHVIKGKAKSGKSSFMVGLIATLLIGKNMGFKALEPNCKAFYIDTEQNPLNTAKLTKRIHAICNIPGDINHERFRAMNLRGDDPIDRKKYINQAINTYKPDLVILDGIKDIIIGGDINSATDCNMAVQFLMALTKEYNLAIFTVLHENKNDENLRGHVGTELHNKCCEVWQVKREDKTFRVEQIENRNNEANIRFAFRYGHEFLQELVEAETKFSKSEKIYKRKIESFYHCLRDNKFLSYSDLKQEYCQAYGCKEKQAENDIGTFSRDKYLEKDEKSKEYRFNPLKIPIIGNPQTSNPP